MSVAKQRIRTQSPQTEPSWFFVILVSGFLTGALLFTIWWYFSLPQTHRDIVNQKMQELGGFLPEFSLFQRSKIILVMGVDIAPNKEKNFNAPVRTDTIMLVRVDPYNRKINVVSIPRDSKVFIPGYEGSNKINAAFAMGGADLAVSTVESSFGIDVDNYLVANVYGVREFVNALGGIDIFVEKPMRYRDYTAGLNINLQPGYQHLNGEEAEGFVRFRHDALADIGRIRRQQQFMMAVLRRFKDPKVLLNIKPLLDAKNEYILTDMSSQDILRLAFFAKNLEPSDIQVATMPGHPSGGSVSYWVIEPEQAELVLNRMITNRRIVSEDELNGMEETGPTVGILYAGAYADSLSEIENKLSVQGYKVICKSRLHQKSTVLISHEASVSEGEIGKIRNAVPALKDVQLIFSPHGGTFETNSCGHSDYTIVLGEDTTRSDI